MENGMPKVQGDCVISTGNTAKAQDVVVNYKNGKTKDELQLNTLQEAIIKELAANNGDKNILSLEDLDLNKINVLKQKYNIKEIHQNIDEEGVVRLVFGDSSNLRIDFQNKNEKNHIKAQEYQEKYKEVGAIRYDNDGIYVTRTNMKRSFWLSHPVAGAKISDYTGDFDKFYDKNSYLIPERDKDIFKKDGHEMSNGEYTYLSEYELSANEEYFIPYEILN